MNELDLSLHRSTGSPLLSSVATVNLPMQSANGNSQELLERLKRISNPTPAFEGDTEGSKPSLEERLFAARGNFKIFTSQVAMHLPEEWRQRLFQQLDDLLEYEEWDDRDHPPSLKSFRTFLRLILLLKPHKRPGLGASSDGHIVAAWTVATSKLTIECLPDDMIRWSISRDVEDYRERVVGETALTRLPAILTPFGMDTVLYGAK